MRFDATDTGRRVTLRRALPDSGGRMGDVVGTLDSWADGILMVTKRSGEQMIVPEESLVAGKVVAPEIGSSALQLRCAADWTPAEVVPLDSWTLRYHFGLNRRSCSALALTLPEAPWADHLERVRDWYRTRGAPALVLTVEGSAVDSALDTAGVPAVLHNHVMVAPAADIADAAPRAGGLRFRVEAQPTEAFLTLNTDDDAERPALTSLLGTAPGARYATGTLDGHPVASGRVGPRDGWAGLTHLDVATPVRRQGIGSALVGALAREAIDAGARDLWLQVERDNAAAIAMYDRLGFSRHHGYVYRALT